MVCQNAAPLGEGIHSEYKDSLLAIGFESGFFRLIDLDDMSVIHENMIFEAPIMDIAFS